MTQRPRHVLVHATVLGVEDVAGGTPSIVGEACTGMGGCLAPARRPRHTAHLSTTHPRTMQNRKLPAQAHGSPASTPHRPARTAATPPLTVNAQHPLTLVFWAGLKLLDDIPAALKGHTCHLGQSKGLSPG